jgi:hypothetical protein
MNLFPLFQWFEATAIGTVVRESLWLFPVIECVHLLALSLLGGVVLAVDLRMLGLGLKSPSAANLELQLRPWLAGALATMIATGVPMFLSEAVKCYYSPPFFYKIQMLIVASVFTFAVKRRVLQRMRPVWNRITAVTSLALWFGVAFAGRWIAFY